MILARDLLPGDAFYGTWGPYVIVDVVPCRTTDDQHQVMVILVGPGSSVHRRYFLFEEQVFLCPGGPGVPL